MGGSNQIKSNHSNQQNGKVKNLFFFFEKQLSNQQDPNFFMYEDRSRHKDIVIKLEFNCPYKDIPVINLHSIVVIQLRELHL